MGSIDSIKIFGKQQGQDFPDWTQDISLGSSLEELEIQKLNLANDSLVLEKSQISNIPGTTKQDRSKLEPASQVSQDKSSENISTKSKSVVFLTLRSIWRWYISGFKSRPDLPLFLSPRLYRIIFTLFAFVWITTPLGWYENTNSSVETSSGSNLPSVAATPVDPTSDIGKTDQNGVKITVDVPKASACSRTHVSVKMDTFEVCLVDGLTYVQVANVLGYRGELQTKSGNIEIWQWNDGMGKYLSATFDNGKLVSKAQVGLEPGS